MVKSFLLFLNLLLFPSLLNSQDITGRFFTAYSYESLTVSTVAVTFNPALVILPSPFNFRAQLITFTLSGCRIRYRIGATLPTATEGEVIEIGSGKLYNFSNISRINFIRDTSCGVDGTLKATYYR